ncbi:unnamed protein product [Allacma fusca]|uniref:Uncharacterized protein n=1 Tax=Allacma fusca TaxID=39272 RepID=A0A8J2PT74_9HEXA|nr:unnamed protein product [Allacma fusca]
MHQLNTAVMCLGETWLKETTDSNEIASYNLHRKDRDTNGGGLLTYIVQQHDKDHHGDPSFLLKYESSDAGPTKVISVTVQSIAAFASRGAAPGIRDFGCNILLTKVEIFIFFVTFFI